MKCTDIDVSDVEDICCEDASLPPPSKFYTPLSAVKRNIEGNSSSMEMNSEKNIQLFRRMRKVAGLSIMMNESADWKISKEELQNSVVMTAFLFFPQSNMK